jgi:hypothetical protein
MGHDLIYAVIAVVVAGGGTAGLVPYLRGRRARQQGRPDGGGIIFVTMIAE